MPQDIQARIRKVERTAAALHKMSIPDDDRAKVREPLLEVMRRLIAFYRREADVQSTLEAVSTCFQTAKTALWDAGLGEYGDGFKPTIDHLDYKLDALLEQAMWLCRKARDPMGDKACMESPVRRLPPRVETTRQAASTIKEAAEIYAADIGQDRRRNAAHDAARRFMANNTTCVVCAFSDINLLEEVESMVLADLALNPDARVVVVREDPDSALSMYNRLHARLGTIAVGMVGASLVLRERVRHSADPSLRMACVGDPLIGARIDHLYVCLSDDLCGTQAAQAAEKLAEILHRVVDGGTVRVVGATFPPVQDGVCARTARRLGCPVMTCGRGYDWPQYNREVLTFGHIDDVPNMVAVPVPEWQVPTPKRPTEMSATPSEEKGQRNMDLIHEALGGEAAVHGTQHTEEKAPARTATVRVTCAGMPDNIREELEKRFTEFLADKSNDALIFVDTYNGAPVHVTITPATQPKETAAAKGNVAAATPDLLRVAEDALRPLEPLFRVLPHIQALAAAMERCGLTPSSSRPSLVSRMVPVNDSAALRQAWASTWQGQWQFVYSGYERPRPGTSIAEAVGGARSGSAQEILGKLPNLQSITVKVDGRVVLQQGHGVLWALVDRDSIPR